MWKPIKEWRNENLSASVKLMQVGSGMERHHLMMVCNGYQDYQLKIQTFDVAAATQAAQEYFETLCAILAM